jgi:hypothetical protein
MFGFMTERSDYRSYIPSLNTMIPAIVISGVLPTYVGPLILASAQIVPAARKALEYIDHIATAARGCVAQRLKDPREDKERHHDLLEQLLVIQHQWTQ